MEKELSITLSNYDTVSSQRVTDVRHAVLSKQQCKKISSVFYENDSDGLSSFIREVEAQMEDNQPDEHPRER